MSYTEYAGPFFISCTWFPHPLKIWPYFLYKNALWNNSSLYSFQSDRTQGVFLMLLDRPFRKWELQCRMLRYRQLLILFIYRVVPSIDIAQIICTYSVQSNIVSQLWCICTLSLRVCTTHTSFRPSVYVFMWLLETSLTFCHILCRELV